MTKEINYELYRIMEMSDESRVTHFGNMIDEITGGGDEYVFDCSFLDFGGGNREFQINLYSYDERFQSHGAEFDELVNSLTLKYDIAVTIVFFVWNTVYMTDESL